MYKYARAIAAAAALAALTIAAIPQAKADITYYTAPKFKHKVLPVYPDSARAAHETGSVLVKILVAADGTAKQFILFKSSGHKDLDDAVMAAVRASTFSPAVRGSSPQTAFYDVTYKFNLTGLAQDEATQSNLAKRLDENPKDVNTRIALGTQYLNLKNFGQAEQLFQQGTQLVPDSAKLWAYLGVANFQDGEASNDYDKYKAAADAYDKALSIDPHVETNNVAAAAYFTYGYHLQQTGDYTDALAYAKKAIAISPKAFQYYILQGEVQTAAGDYANAITSLKQAVSFDDHKESLITARVVADLGNAELANNDKDDGTADLNRSEQINPQAPFAYEYWYSYYLKTGNRAAALTPLNQLEQLQPKDVEWPLAIANIYIGQNNVAAAKQSLEKAQAIAPNDPSVQFGFAQLAAGSGDIATVDSTMSKLTAGSDPKQAAVYEATIAIDLINASQSGKNYTMDAQKYADQSSKADPNNGEAWFALGYAQAQTHDTTDAKTSLKKAYDIFKAQNNQQSMKQVSDLYKNISGGSDINS
jgi:TonB family protein